MKLQPQWLTVRRTWKHFAPFIRQQKLLIAWAFITLLAEIVWRLAEPWSMKFVVDYVIGGKDLRPLPFGRWLAQIDAPVLLTLTVIGMIVITLMRASAEYANTVSFALAGNRVLSAIRNKLYLHLQRLSLSFHTKARNGDLIVRISNDVNMLTDVAVTAGLPLAANSLVMIGMLATMVWINPKLAGLSLLILPIFWLFSVRYGGKIQDAAKQQRKREGALAATASESFSAIKTVQALSLEGVFAQAFSAQNDRSMSEGLRSTQLSKSLERTVDVLLVSANAVVLWFGAQMILNKELSIGDLLVFLSYLKSTLKPIQDFAKYTSRLAKASASAERVIGLLEQEPDVRDAPHARPAPPLRGLVHFDHISFWYEPERPVLQDITFTVQPGQRVAIVGKSGNGKTTLTNLLLRLYDPSAGRVMIDGQDIRNFTIESLRAQISVVMQDTILFAATVRENISFGQPHLTQAEIEQAARLANAHDFIMQMPQGYDTLLGERGVTLSNGQRQRISIARAAIRNTPLLILDEATTGLDKTNEREVLEALNTLSQGRTTFYITHDPAHIQPGDVLLQIEQGQLHKPENVIPNPTKAGEESLSRFSADFRQMDVSLRST